MSSVRSYRRAFLGGWHLALPIVALAIFRDLWAPDEPRYAQIAREAWTSGSLVVLHICGDVYPDKPPLVYWLMALAGELGGWTGFALRVPSILATLGSAWVAARIARRHFGDLVAAWTPTFYLGTAMVVWFGGRVQLDPLLAFFCLAAVDLVWTDGGTVRERTRRFLLAGLCAGLAALCKGPVAWLHVGFAIVALFAVPGVARATRATTRWSGSAWLGFVLLALLPVVTWAVAAASREPSLWKPLFLGQHLGRATSVDAPHAGPPWEYLWQFPALLLPWTGLACLGFAAAFRAWRDARRAHGTTVPIGSSERGLVRALTWFTLVFVVFSIMPPKRELYLLPLYPVAAWFAAFVFARALERGHLATFVTRSATALMLLLGLGAVIVPRIVTSTRPDAYAIGHAAWPAGIAFVVVAIASAVFLRRGDLARWADSIALGLTTGGVAAAICVLPLVDVTKSARTLAREIAARPEKPAEIPCWGVQPEGYRFYADVPTVRGELADFETGPQRFGADFLALVSEREWDNLPADFRAPFTIRHRRQVGSRDVLVIGVAR